jgi:hypothetical protein
MYKLQSRYNTTVVTETALAVTTSMESYAFLVIGRDKDFLL